MFVDPETLEMIHDVAARLAASAASPEAWSSTELGRIVRFADDRSQDRVRRIFTRYGDASLQEKGVFMKMRRERTAFLTTYMPKGAGNIMSRAMGLASLCQAKKSIEAGNKMRRQCESRLAWYGIERDGPAILVGTNIRCSSLGPHGLFVVVSIMRLASWAGTTKEHELALPYGWYATNSEFYVVVVIVVVVAFSPA